MQEYNGPYWILNLPEQWQGHHGGDSETIFFQDGVGVIDINSVMNDVTAKDADLLFYASDYLNKAGDTESVHFGEFSGISIEYDEDGDYWWRAYVKAGRVIILISYNCKTNEKRLELEAAKEILQSLSVRWDI